jgi:hypothetical protein
MRRTRFSPPGGRELSGVQGADHGFPVDPCPVDLVAGAGVDMHVACEVVSAEVDAVADEQPGCGLVWVQAVCGGPERRAELAGHWFPFGEVVA